MNVAASVASPVEAAPAPTHLPARRLVVRGPAEIAIVAGTEHGNTQFSTDWPVPPPADGYQAGADYFVTVDGAGLAAAVLAEGLPDERVLGGFHFAPGGNAEARAGGDSAPAINPYSVWDVGFRPACPDPRGMTLVEGLRGLFWCDIYLTAQQHLAGTSRYGVTIADGDSLPESIDGEKFDAFDFAAAGKVLAHHGKRLLSVEEYFAAAYGVTERSAAGEDPGVTGLDAPRTSKWGLMQATGNLWVWGHDGDPDEPRACIFGGSWLLRTSAGSRRAVVDGWPGGSGDVFGARGRCDHLQHA